MTRFAVVALVVVLAAVAASTAHAQMRSVTRACHDRPVPVLCAIHQHRNAVWHYQDLLGVPHTRYGWAAERSSDRAFWGWVRNLWYHRHIAWRARYRAAIATPYPAWFADVMACISTHEEYGIDGQNTVAGYFGLVSPPSAYPDPGPAVAAQYGDSWLDVPLEAQIAVSYGIEQTYGFTAWSTHAMCGV